MTTYQGHRNWNHWNVSLWLMNEEPLYRLCQYHIRKCRTMNDAAKAIALDLPTETPDGAPYSYTAIRAAITNWNK